MHKPADSELKLLRRLWEAQRLSAREIHDATCGETGWAYSTTRKVLDRMEEKRLVKVKAVHGLKTYAAARPKLETLARLIKDFAHDVLASDAPLPVAAFAHSRIIAPEEIAQLEELLKRLEE